jgi:RNA recognition motif-containing protein
VYVINLDRNTTESELLEAFKMKSDGAYKARVLMDKDGSSKGAAFVDYSSSADAQKAVQSCQNIEVGNKKLLVQMAKV